MLMARWHPESRGGRAKQDSIFPTSPALKRQSSCQSVQSDAKHDGRRLTRQEAASGAPSQGPRRNGRLRCGPTPNATERCCRQTRRQQRRHPPRARASSPACAPGRPPAPGAVAGVRSGSRGRPAADGVACRLPRVRTFKRRARQQRPPRGRRAQRLLLGGRARPSAAALAPVGAGGAQPGAGARRSALPRGSPRRPSSERAARPLFCSRDPRRGDGLGGAAVAPLRAPCLGLPPAKCERRGKALPRRPPRPPALAPQRPAGRAAAPGAAASASLPCRAPRSPPLQPGPAPRQCL